MEFIESDLMEDFPYFVTYPHKLLSAILSGTNLSKPNTLSRDSLFGIQYAFLKLDLSTQKLLWLRYVQMLSLSDVANYLSVTEAELDSLEKAAMSYFRRSGSWGYIRYGIEGNLRSKLKESRRVAYHNGYCDGYIAAARCAGLELSQLYCDSSVLDYSIDILQLSERTKHCLRNNGLTGIRDVVNLSDRQIRSMRGLGKQCANEVVTALHRHHILHTAWDKYLL